MKISAFSKCTVFVNLLRPRLSECTNHSADRVPVILRQCVDIVGEKGAKDEQ